MAVRVVTVNRRDKIGGSERLFIPAIAKAFFVSMGHFFRNLKTFASGKQVALLVQYPEEQLDYADAFRGMPVLVQLDSGKPRCVACGLCEFACPSDCISIVPGELEGAGIERYPEVFDFDLSRCMFCGLCEEACPEEAIVMSREVELATTDRSTLLYHKEELLVPQTLLKRRLEFLRGEYDRTDAVLDEGKSDG